MEIRLWPAREGWIWRPRADLAVGPPIGRIGGSYWQPLVALRGGGATMSGQGYQRGPRRPRRPRRTAPTAPTPKASATAPAQPAQRPLSARSAACPRQSGRHTALPASPSPVTPLTPAPPLLHPDGQDESGECLQGVAGQCLAVPGSLRPDGAESKAGTGPRYRPRARTSGRTTSSFRSAPSHRNRGTTRIWHREGRGGRVRPAPDACRTGGRPPAAQACRPGTPLAALAGPDTVDC